jgi:hypothetical protein
MIAGSRLAAGFTLAGVVLAAGAASPALAVSGSDCQHRINGTEKRLLECIKPSALWHHLENLQKIADEHPGSKGHGNRDTGTQGYLASANYVAGLMQQAGYRVHIQSYQWRHSKTAGAQRLTIDGHAYRESQDWFVATLSGSGVVAAAVAVPHDGSQTLSSETGCTSAAFRGFRRGSVALLRRGACDFDAQVANAERAGASAVILYNDRTAPDSASHYRKHADGKAFPAVLTQEAHVPVVGAVSYALGASLAAQSLSGHAPPANIDIRTETKSDTDYNVIADSPFGDADHTVVVDAHLDSIYGAGILDNGSGSATILEIARNLANTPTKNRLRYIWFGGEELGLLGSRYYTRNLRGAELKKIAFDIDVDVTATPNYAVLIADPGHATKKDKFPPNVIPESQIGNREFARYFRTIGIPARIAGFGNDGTDSLAFSLVGVPNTGILTQQNCCKHDWEVRLWGGFTGNFEGKVPGRNGGCVDTPRRWCDNLSNNNRAVLGFVSKAVADVVFQIANDDTVGRSR